jgi:hypothetical protein
MGETAANALCGKKEMRLYGQGLFVGTTCRPCGVGGETTTKENLENLVQQEVQSSSVKTN